MSTETLKTGFLIHAKGTAPEVTITTPTRDLMRDTIDPFGMDTTRYLAGPAAVNFAHDHSRLPVAKTTSLRRSPQGIRARFRWLDHPDAQQVRAVFEAGVLGASVEFVSVESERNRDGGIHFAKTVLTGWALTGNPANPECVRMLKSLSVGRDYIDLDAIAFNDEIDVTPADVVAALREGFAALKVAPPDELVGLTASDVAAALREVVADEVGRGVRRAITQARGRVD